MVMTGANDLEFFNIEYAEVKDGWTVWLRSYRYGTRLQKSVGFTVSLFDVLQCRYAIEVNDLWGTIYQLLCPGTQAILMSVFFKE